MKQILLLLFTFVTIASCRNTTGSGKLITQTRPAGNFDGITVSGDFEVEVKIGAVTSVVVEADDNIMKYIETSTVGSTIKIYTEGLHNYSDVHMKLYITTPSLKKISASASADVMVENVLVSTGKLVFKASSGADIKTEVDAPEVSADASSGATISLHGKTKVYSAESSSGADIKSWDLMSENTTVSVSSGADAKVHASVKLNASASSGASVTYHGAANVVKSVSSGASIGKRD
ncbi:MAG: head GIN domain-containing protein [Ferruginibacter sp.]